MNYKRKGGGASSQTSALPPGEAEGQTPTGDTVSRTREISELLRNISQCSSSNAYQRFANELEVYNRLGWQVKVIKEEMSHVGV